MFVNYEDSLQGIILKVSIFSLLKPGCLFNSKYYPAFKTPTNLKYPALHHRCYSTLDP